MYTYQDLLITHYNTHLTANGFKRDIILIYYTDLASVYVCVCVEEDTYQDWYSCCHSSYIVIKLHYLLNSSLKQGRELD